MPSRPPLVALLAVLTVSAVRAQQSEAARNSFAFAEAWKAACVRPVPKDSGLVYGQVRDARTGRPAAKAHVDVVWYQVKIGENKAVTQRQWKLDTQTDERGQFGICGIPTDEWLRIGSGSNGRISGLIDLVPGESRWFGRI